MPSELPVYSVAGGRMVARVLTGNATLVGGTVTIANTGVNANTRVYTSLKTVGGTLGVHYQYDILAGTSVTINSIDAAGSIETGDTSVISYIILN